MRILVTGAAGGIGGRLAKSLLADGHKIVAIDDLSAGNISNLPQSNDYEFHQLDLASCSTDRLLQMGQVDSVVHLAGLSSLAVCQKNPMLAMSSNVLTTVNMSEYCRRTGAGIVFSSTSAVYEGLTYDFFSEGNEIEPRLTYPLTKRMAEQTLSAFHETYGMPHVTLRLFNVFGEDQDISRVQPPFVNYLFREISNGRRPTVFAPLEQSRDYVYIDDVVEAVKLSLAYVGEKNSGTFNVCSSVGISVGAILSAFAEGAGLTDSFYEAGSAENFWDAYSEIHEGAFPIHRYVVEQEVLKHSLGSPLEIKEKLGWEPSTRVLDAIRNYASRLRKSRQVLD